MSDSKSQCTNCLKFFYSKFLAYHMTKCLIKKEFTCSFCFLSFCSKQSLERHLSICKTSEFSKQFESQSEILSSLEKALEDEKNKIIAFEKQIDDLQNKIKCLERALNEKDSIIKDKDKTLNNTINLLQKQSNTPVNQTIVNNNNFTYNTQINNLLANVEPIKKEDLAFLIQDIISNPMLPDHPSNFASNVHNRYLKPRLIKSDNSRKVVNWKDDNNKLIKDPKAKVITEKILEAGKPYFEEKIVQLKEDILSPTANAQLVENISNWINVCTSLANKTESCKNDIAATIAELADDKAAFELKESETRELTDVETFFFNVLNNQNSFKLFTGDVKGFGYMLKENYEDHWIQGVSVMDFRPTRSDDYKPLPFDKFKKTMLSFMDDCNFLNKVINDALLQEEGLTCWNEGFIVKCSRKDCVNLIEKTVSTLLESDKAWETVYDILLGIE